MKTILLIMAWVIGLSCQKQENIQPSKQKIRLVVHADNASRFEWGAVKYGNNYSIKNTKYLGAVNLDTTFYLSPKDEVMVFMDIVTKPEYKLTDFIEIYQNDSLQRMIYKKQNYNYFYTVK